jgi:hypothetical protein
MISAVIISTPLIDFYYSFRLYNNIMFIEITERLSYNQHTTTKLYHCFYNDFIQQEKWFYLYNLSLFTSRPTNNNTKIVVDIFWCLMYKQKYKYIKPIESFHYDNDLKTLLYKPSDIMNNCLITCIINSLTNDIDVIEDIINTVGLYHKLITFVFYAEIELKLNTNCIEYILAHCF